MVVVWHLINQSKRLFGVMEILAAEKRVFVFRKLRDIVLLGNFSERGGN